MTKRNRTQTAKEHHQHPESAPELGRAQISRKGRSLMVGIFRGIVGIVALILIWFAAQVGLANRTAAGVFEAPYCWLRPGEDVTNLKELSFAGTGFFVPNPARQVNRRLLGFGIDDVEVRSPHFAILAFGADGTPQITGWSYRRFGFFTQDQTVLRHFVSQDTVAACRTALTAEEG
ncbi:hypothetical protein [Planktotalea arctica]|uniref:hypothetical protein n=1 Tax=Planktotalea arctica TaxID=1481893 RepID=UPI0032198D75